ncbi:FAD-binding protein [Candidatus Bathyarchaeota archaeon]|nr:FAD-binding protein [Candidatus Bathyarchaeota archaeon]
MVSVLDTDILVIGSGAAGLRAAIEAYETGCEIIIISKAPMGMNNSTFVSGGGFRAAINDLTPEEHFFDSMKVGKNINDPKLLKILSNEGEKCCIELKKYGVDIRINKEGISVGKAPTPGWALTEPMVKYIKNLGIEFYENIIITKLLKKGGRIIGAVGFDFHNNNSITIRTKTIILATGGAGALYKRTDCPLHTTGDGYSLGYHAGAKLRDMEFVQFFPIALAEAGVPPSLIGGTIAEEGKIMNALGEDIPKKYRITSRPYVLKSRDLLSRAMMIEINQGGGVDGSVLIDAREVFEKKSQKEIASEGLMKTLVEKLKALEKPFKVAPISHFCMGGLVIDENGYTGVPGLYAAGEVVGGVHGANRHGGNALTEAIVFGKRAGAAAAKNAKKNKRSKTLFEDLVEEENEKYNLLQKRESGFDAFILMNRLRETMWAQVGIIRDSISLSDAFEEIIDLRNMAYRISAADGQMVLSALELLMGLDTAEIIIRSAMERKESRGAHYRKDYPNETSSYNKPLYISKTSTGSIKIEK